MKQPCDAPTENAAWSAVIVHLAAAIVDRTRLMLDVVDADGDVIDVAPGQSPLAPAPYRVATGLPPLPVHRRVEYHRAGSTSTTPRPRSSGPKVQR